MQIGIAANYLLFEQAGIGKYTENLLKNLFKIDHKPASPAGRNHYILYFSYFRHREERAKLISQKLGNLPKNVSIKFLRIPAAWLEYLFTTKISVRRIIPDNLDLFFSPYVTGIPKNGFSKMVVMVHDLVFMRFPEHRGKKLSNYYLKRHKIAIQNCQKIIVPSMSTKLDLINLLDANAKKIVLIPEAADERFKPIKDPKKIKQIISQYFDPSFKYILSVGTLEPRKNLAKLVEAFSLLPHQILKNYRLVLVGAKGWNNSPLYQIISDLNIGDKIILSGFVSDEDLPYIYNGAKIFVYPSLYEGFGLPPLEALACGLPIISSKTSSMGEVIGKAGILIDPENEKEIAGAIKLLINKPKLAQKLSKQALAQAKKFSWGKAAKETLKVFEEVVR